MLNFILDLVFPYRCIDCRKYLERQYVCQPCLHKLPINKVNNCVGCQRPTPLGKTCAFCKDDYAFDQLLVASDYNHKVISGMIHAFKYRFLPDLAPPLAQLMAKHVDHLAKRDHFSMVHGNPLLVPVPLFKTREYFRGFNQAELLARLIARRYRLDVSRDLIRVAKAVPQVDMKDRLERLSNIHGLYTCKNPEVFKGRNIILVDDVCTTGATLNECARILKEAGATYVLGLAIARG